MSVKRNDEIFPWLYHGGPINLGSLMKQVIEINVRFPHTGTEGQWICTPVTLNLSTDIGITSNARVYAVDWEGSDDTTTISNTMNSYKHEHTFELVGTQSSYEKTYRITLYGDPLLPHYGYEYGLGTGDSSYHVTSIQISLESPINVSVRSSKDNTIPSGARISRAFFGDLIVYGKKVAGATLEVEIELTGNENTARLVNPLVSGYNDWTNIKTDMFIEWGDGRVDYIVNRYINTGLCNDTSNTIVEHKYSGTAGQKFIMRITSVEPVIPIGVKVISLDGSLPEDCYTGHDGFMNYDSILIEEKPYRAELNNHRSTISSLGSNLCDNWVNNTRLINTFLGWTAVKRIENGFFKDNILSECEEFDSTFSGMSSLIYTDPLLFGRENNVVKSMYSVFMDSPVENVVELETANNLEVASGVYAYTKVKTADNFLTSAPKLKQASFLFEDSLLQSHNVNMLIDSTLLEETAAMFKNTKMTNMIFRFNLYSKLYNLVSMYDGCPLSRISTTTFGGVFATETQDGSVVISNLFANIGTDESYTIIEDGAFKPLANISDKLNSRVNTLLYNAKVNSLHEGMFDSVFKSDTPRFILTSLLKGVKTSDDFGYDIPCINIPDIFSNCNGVLELINTFGNINIGDISTNLLISMNGLSNVTDAFKNSNIYNRKMDKLFKTNVNISKWSGLFNGATFKFNEIPLDRIINSNVSTIDITDMLNTSNDIYVYRLFDSNSEVKSVNSTNGQWIKNKQSIPLSIIFGNRQTNITDVSYDIRPVIFDVVVLANNVSIVFTPKDQVSSIDVKIDRDPFENVPTNPNYTKSLTKGHHRIEVKSNTSVKLTGDDFKVVRITGEYPYNSIVDFNNCDHYQLREIGRNVFSACNHQSVHNEGYFGEFIPILHKEIFNYHDDVNRSIFLNRDQHTLTGVYGVQPHIFDNMISLTSLDQTYTSYMKVLTPNHIPSLPNLNGISASIFGVNDTSRVSITDTLVSDTITDYTCDKAQVVTNKSLNIQKGRPRVEYLEMRLEGFNGTLKLSKLTDEPTFPITVELISKSVLEPNRLTINSFEDEMQVSTDCLIRIYSDVPVWIDQKNYITELYGSIPRCQWSYKMLDLCPNLRRVGELLLINIENTSVYQLFKGLQKFEYFPGTLFWYNDKLVDYEESFTECPLLFKVDDYIITAKKGDINCRNMFKNSGVRYVRKPIMDDVYGKVNIDGMFEGCYTGFYYGFDNIDDGIFKNIHTIGTSGIKIDSTSILNDDENLYIETSSTNIQGLQASYFIDESLLVDISDANALKFASQSIAGQSLPLDRSKVTIDMVKYLPWIYKLIPINKGSQISGLYDYMEWLTNMTPVSDVSDGNPFLRNNIIKDITDVYNGVNCRDKNILQLLPIDCGNLSIGIRSFNNTSNVSIPENTMLPKHILSNLNKMFSHVTYDVSKGIYNNVELSSIDDNSVIITGCFEDSTEQTSEVGIFKVYGNKLHTTTNTHVYKGCINLVDLNEDMYSNCGNLEVTDYHFSDCHKLSKLPIINNLTKLYSYQHMFERTAVTSVPENYIYTTRNDKDIMLDYMFANCPVLFIENKFIDVRSPGYFSIDYSLNDVLTSVGEDLEIFGHINYDDEFEHRSRVILFDERIGWVQNIRTTSSNQIAKVTSLQIPNLVGYTPNSVISIIWGDDSRPVVIRPGETITEDVISHTYINSGDYVFKVMMQDVTAYLETTGTNIITTELPTSFKFGSINDIKTKTLVSMFGTTVEKVDVNLFTKLEDIESVEVYTNMFRQFKKLTDLPVGILDCMPKLYNIDGLLSDSKSDDTNLVLRAGLIDNLHQLRSFNRAALNSNITNVESGFFKSQHSGITSITDILSNSKCVSIPTDLFNPLINLTDGTNMLRNASSFILDTSYDSLFISNKKLSKLDGSFSGVKINGLGANMLSNIGASLTSTNDIFAINDSYTKGSDDNDWNIPDNFMQGLTGLVSSSNMFRGRLSLKRYPIGLLDSTKASLNNTMYMFSDTGITEIHHGTITGKTINMDARYMFYGCIVRNCPKVVTNSTGTIKTTGMLKGSSGELTEIELFEGIKTDPIDIQSMYRQEFKFFYMDVTLDSNEEVYVHALENTFPWDGYVIDVQYGSDLITITENISSQDQLKTLTKKSLSVGDHTIGVKAPFAIELRTISGNVIKFKRLYGSFGKMYTNQHIEFKNTGFGKIMDCIIDDDEFYKYNTHLTSMRSAFSETKIKYIKTDAFKYLTNVSDISRLFNRNTVYSIKEGYKPNFNIMKLNDVSFAYEYCTSFITNKDYEPFKDISTISQAVNVFARSGIITTPRVNTTSLINAQGMYWTCDNLTTTYADILDNANKCTNFYGVFGHNPKLTVIEGESDTKSIMSSINSSVNSIDLHEAFIDTGLSYQQVIRIINNIGIVKSTNQISLNCTDMFRDTIVRGTEKGNLRLSINAVNKVIDATRMFYNCGMNEIPKQAINITGSLIYKDMFYNCFADKSVQYLDQVFLVSTHDDNTDYRDSELDTLNVFDLNITSSELSVINLKYVGAVNLSNVRYVEVKVGTNDSETYYTETVDELEGLSINIPAGTTKLSIYSVPLIMPIKQSGDFDVTSVDSHLSTHRDNYTDWSSKFSFGTYFGNAKTFNIRLGGQFYVKDGDFYTLNGIFKGMKYITSYPRDIFIDYKGGTVDGVNKIVGLIETFADNIALTNIEVGMLQYISGIESIRRTWYNTAITEVKDGVFASCNRIMDTYEAFGNNNITKLPPRLIVINE